MHRCMNKREEKELIIKIDLLLFLLSRILEGLKRVNEDKVQDKGEDITLKTSGLLYLLLPPPKYD